VEDDVEKLIILSSGWGHCLQISPTTQTYIWLNDFTPEYLKLRGWRKIFQVYHSQLKRQKLKNAQSLSFASQDLKSQMELEGKVIYPGFKSDDYFVVDDSQHSGLYPYHLVNLKNANLKDVKILFEIAKKIMWPLNV
jgi:hypothetical protein